MSLCLCAACWRMTWRSAAMRKRPNKRWAPSAVRPLIYPCKSSLAPAFFSICPPSIHASTYITSPSSLYRPYVTFTDSFIGCSMHPTTFSFYLGTTSIRWLTLSVTGHKQFFRLKVGYKLRIWINCTSFQNKANWKIPLQNICLLDVYYDAYFY